MKFYFFFFLLFLNTSIFANNTYKVLYPKDFAPHYQYIDGKQSGFAIEYVESVAKYANIKLEYIGVDNWDDFFNYINDVKDYDIVPNIGISKAREKYFDFCTPYEEFENNLYVRKKSNYKNINDLYGKSLGVTKNIVALENVNNLDLNLIYYKSYEEAILAFLTNKVDSIIVPNTLLDSIINALGIDNDVRKIKTMTKVSRAIAVKKGNEELFKLLNEKSIEFSKTNEYKKLYDKWFNQKGEHLSQNDIQKYMALAILFIILLIAFVLEKLFNKKLIYSREYLENQVKTTESTLDIEKLKLKRVKESFNMAQSIAHIGSFDWDIKKNILWWSDEMYNLYGKDKNIFTPTYQSFLDNVYYEDVESVATKVQNSLAGIEEYDIKFRLNRNDEVIHIYAQANIMRDENNKAIRMIGINQDISFQVDLEDKLNEVNKYLQNQVENQLRKRVKSEIIYKVLFENDMNAIAIVENDLIIDCNDTALKLLDISDKDEIIKKDIFEFSPQYQPDGELSIIKRDRIRGELALKKKVEFDWLYTTNTHKELYAKVQLFITKVDNKELLYIIWNDITKERVLEQKQIKQEKILIQQSKMAAMGEMIAMIAHQWRQPLTAILALTQAIEFKSKQNSLSSEFVENQIKQTKDIILHMSKTIDDFRDFFKPKTQQEEIDIKTIINKAIEFTLSTLKQYSIVVENRVVSDRKFLIHSTELMQVILNIISNAKDALIECDNIDRKIIIYLDEYDNYSILTIKDNAKGVPEDIIDNIFEPYFSTKSKNGTGLGLYMSKVIIEEHLDGKLWVINSDDGAEFKIKLHNI